MSDDTTIYRVVVNHEEQYSIWPVGREIPAGWREAGKSGTKPECLAYIEEVWTDMRPLSLRKAMDAAAAAPAGTPTPAPVDDLVERLCAGSHPVQVLVDRLEEDLAQGYVHVRFTGTRGGTELGVRLDPSKTVKAGGRLRVVGDLTLNFEKVRCSAEVEVATGVGEGRLERV
jgi:uncharacterized protein YbdZ (MbtH family)